MPITTRPTDKAAKGVTISVNGADVKLSEKTATGAAIKQAAIAANVPIQPDFVLYAQHGKSEYTKIDDDEVVKLHPGEKFRAVAPDDVA